MTTHHVAFHPLPVAADQLDLSNAEATTPAVIRPADTSGAFSVEIPAGELVDIRITGFAADGLSYAITAISRVEGAADAIWTTSGNDAVSPAFSRTGDYEIDVTAAAGSGANAVRRLSTVSVKIRQPGRPDDFLSNQFDP